MDKRKVRRIKREFGRMLCDSEYDVTAGDISKATGIPVRRLVECIRIYCGPRAEHGLPCTSIVRAA